MRIRDILTEYEHDYVKFSSKIKSYDHEIFQNKIVLLAGSGNSTFLRSLVYSLMALNDENYVREEPLGLKLEVVLTDHYDSGLYDRIKERKDFTLHSLDTVQLNSDIDFAIYTGICNEEVLADAASFTSQVDICNRMFDLIAECKVEKCIYLSDYRAYSTMDRPFVFAEYEVGTIDLFEERAVVTELLQTCESLCSCYAKQFGFDYIILRPGRIYGADVFFSANPLYDYIDDVLNEKDAEWEITEEKYSYVYLNDVIRAVFFSLDKLPVNTSFNVVGKDPTTSILDLYTILYDNFPEKIKVSLRHTNKKTSYGVPLDGSKLKHYGWFPTLEMERGLVLLLKSKMQEEAIFTFDHTYNGKLDTVHNILLGYLLDIDRICKKHNIKYFLAGGTLLGAIRHHGFIPWDDDADVMMLREDYDKFLSVVQDELADNLFLQTPQTEDLNHCVFTKIRMDNTVFATKFTSKMMEMHNGIFVDVLAHDKTSNSMLLQKVHGYLTKHFRLLVLRKWGETPVKSRRLSKISKWILTRIRNIIPMSFLEWCQNKLLVKYKNKDTKYLYDGMGRNIQRGAFPKEWLDECTYVDFEGYQLPVPKQYDEYLSYLYGDYMEMIPVSKRKVSHSIVLMDLGEYSDYKLSEINEKSSGCVCNKSEKIG